MNKKRSARMRTCASQATALGARMCQGTFFFILFIIGDFNEAF